jgi:hypothetical protein
MNLEEVKEFITGELAAALQGVGIRYAPVTGKPKGLTHEQSKIATAVRKKLRRLDSSLEVTSLILRYTHSWVTRRLCQGIKSGLSRTMTSSSGSAY